MAVRPSMLDRWYGIVYCPDSMECAASEKNLEGWDGTAIAYRVSGSGIPVLLANGLTGTKGTWRHLHTFLSDRARMVSWDYRGLYGSSAPEDHSHLRVSDHVRDAVAVLDAERIESTVAIGWDMGVQVILELLHRAPVRVRALVCISGTYGRPFETAFNWKGTGLVVPTMARGVSRRPGVVSWMGRRFAAQPGLIRLARRAGLVGRSLDEDLFLEMSREFGAQDVRIYTRVFRELGRHDATQVLPEIDVPTLIIAGEQDLLTPRRVAEKMARRIRGAELTLVPGATHFLPLEYPEFMNLRIEKFLCEHGLLEADSRSSRRPLRASAAAHDSRTRRS